TAGKSLVVLQDLLDSSTLAAEVIRATTRLNDCAITTTAIAGATSALVPGVGAEPVPRSIFKDFSSPSTVESDVVGPSEPAGAELINLLLRGSFPNSRDYEELFVEFNVGVARQACFSAEVSQVFVIKATKSTRVAEMNNLKEWTVALEG
nr:hypothetical protein [Tanacetum cinerariifolium]